MPVVKKKNGAGSRDQREAEKKLAEYAELMAERGKWAKKIFDAQDESTQQAIREMVDVISEMADQSGEAIVRLENGAIVRLKVPAGIFENGWLWVAIRLCVIAHEWDIQVAKFRPIRKISKKAGVR